MAVMYLKHVETLSETNYESWKLQTKSLLVLNELWAYTNGKIPQTPENLAVWTTMDEKALALITLSVSKNQLIHIKKAETSAEAWESLQEVHESKGPVRKTALYKQLHRMKKESTQSMTQYINEFLSKAEQLDETGIQIPDELLSIMLLNSLPTEYEGFCIGIDDIPSVESLKLKLIKQEARRNDQSNKESSSNNDAHLLKEKRTKLTMIVKTPTMNGMAYKALKTDCRSKKESTPAIICERW